MLYEFALSHNTVKVSKNICDVEGKDVGVYSTLTRWFKKFCSGWVNLDDLAGSEKPKTMEFELMLQAMEANYGN